MNRSDSGMERSGREPPRHDGMDNQSPDEIARDLARTRADLNDTLRALERRFSREEMIDQALDYVRGGPREFAVHLGEQARDNPLPVALVAIGIGWLMFAGRREEREYTSEGLAESGGRFVSREKEKHGEAVESGKEKYGEALETAKEKYGSASEQGKEAVGKAKERGGEMWESAAGTMKELGEKAGEKKEEWREAAGEQLSRARAGFERVRKGLRFRARTKASGMRRGSEETASGIRQTSEQARDTFFNLWREQPLAVAALGVALGAALAAGLPTTRRERETFGPTRDDLVNRARDTGREQMEKTRADLKQAVSEPSPHSGPH